MCSEQVKQTRYLVAAIRRIWRYSSERAACLRAKDPCYACGAPFKIRPAIKITKQKAGPNAGHFFARWTDDVGVHEEIFVTRGEAMEFRALKYKAFNKEFGAQADHVIPVGTAPKTWDGWDEYLKRMFEGKLAKICPPCHKQKTATERSKRAKGRKNA
jgi:hypothetical protein